MPTLQPTFTVYKLITPYAYRDCKKMGGIGVSGCLEWVTRNFKVGDTLISSQSLSPYSNPLTFVDGRLFSGGVEQQVRIPLSVLNKVATNIDASQLNTYINSGSQSNTGTSTPDNKATTTTNNTKTTDSTKFVWTPIKKVVAGALIIGAIYGILKLTKVI